MINIVKFKNKSDMLFKRNREPIQTIKTNSNDITLDFKTVLEQACSSFNDNIRKEE